MIINPTKIIKLDKDKRRFYLNMEGKQTEELYLSHLYLKVKYIYFILCNLYLKGTCRYSLFINSYKFENYVIFIKTKQYITFNLNSKYFAIRKHNSENCNLRQRIVLH